MQSETGRSVRQTIQLERFMADPMLMDDLSIDLLWQLVKEYPYFQTARMLLAKNLDMAGHEAYPLSLRLAAAYAGDRRLLKKLMDTRTTMALVDEKVVVAGVDGEVRGSEVEGKVELSVVDEEVRDSEVDMKVELTGVDEEVRGSGFEFQSIEVAEKVEELQVEELEVEEVKAADIEVEVINEELAEEKEVEQAEEITEEKVEKEVKEDAEKKVAEKIEQKDEERESQLSPLVNLIKSSLTDIGKERSQDPGIDSARSGRKMDPKERNALIDKFITEEPRISAPKKEFFNPLDHARQSSIEHEDLVTETLARIFEQQGHTLKAIKIYEKLVLLIPEKSNYFAARIVELRQLLK